MDDHSHNIRLHISAPGMSMDSITVLAERLTTYLGTNDHYLNLGESPIGKHLIYCAATALARKTSHLHSGEIHICLGMKARYLYIRETLRNRR